jgi:DNA-binding NarL/FixJ family response regulator
VVLDEGVTVLIVEDDARVRQRLAAALAGASGFTLFGVAGSLQAAAALLAHRLPAVALVDLGLPDGDGSTLIRWLTTRVPAPDVLVLSVFGDEQHVVGAIEAGARGYLLKDEGREAIVTAIRELLAGGSPISPAVARHVFARLCGVGTPAADAPRLTPAETDILRLIAKGYSAPEIAGLRGVSTATVPVHIKNIYRKLSVHSRGEAVFEALQLGLIGKG